MTPLTEEEKLILKNPEDYSAEESTKLERHVCVWESKGFKVVGISADGERVILESHQTGRKTYMPFI